MEKKTKAIVARAIPYNETDMILTLVSPDEGRLTATARGCLKPRAKLRYAAEPLNFGDYILTGKGDRYIVADCAQIEAFLPLTTDLSKFYAASMMLETLSKLSSEPQPRLFLASIKELQQMAYDKKGASESARDFLLSALSENGSRLDFGHCGVCKCVLDGDAGFMNADGVVCPHCSGLDALKIDAPTRAYIAGERDDTPDPVRMKANMFLAELVYNMLGVKISRHYFSELL